ncbi:hypothetical protein FACS189475_01510 [Betaproteobacteria bacterium]|nr:hypothetical protein FACS189475_01510 [Betaproteobacteria bacterium]
MAQTFGAVAYGLAHFRPTLPFLGVFANRVGNPRHAELLRAALTPEIAWRKPSIRTGSLAKLSDAASA